MNEAIKLAIEYIENVPDDRQQVTHIDRDKLIEALRKPAKLYTQDDLNREFDEGANRQAEIWKERLDTERLRTKHIEEMNRFLLEHLAKVESLKPQPMILMGAQPDHSELIARLRTMEREGWATDNEIAAANALEGKL